MKYFLLIKKKYSFSFSSASSPSKYTYVSTVINTKRIWSTKYRPKKQFFSFWNFYFWIQLQPIIQAQPQREEALYHFCIFQERKWNRTVRESSGFSLAETFACCRSDNGCRAGTLPIPTCFATCRRDGSSLSTASSVACESRRIWLTNRWEAISIVVRKVRSPLGRHGTHELSSRRRWSVTLCISILDCQ